MTIVHVFISLASSKSETLMSSIGIVFSKFSVLLKISMFACNTNYETVPITENNS